MLLCKKYPFYLLGLLCPFYLKLYMRNAYLRFKIVMLWAIPKPPAPMAKGLSAHLARAGIVAEQPPKIALNWVMIKIAPGQGRAEVVKLATANINLVVVIRVINTLVQGQDTPVVQVPPAEDIILNVIVPHHIRGVVALVSVIVRMLMLVRAPATPVAPALPVAANIPLAPAPLATNGKMVVAEHRMEQLASCIIAMAKLLVYVLQVWASMSR